MKLVLWSTYVVGYGWMVELYSRGKLVTTLRSIFVAVAGVSFLVVSLACCCSDMPAGAPPVHLPSDPEGFIARFGAPDVDDSTERDNPRPIQLTRWLVYKKEDVRVFYIPEGRLGEFPVQGWQHLQFQEADTKELLSSAQVAARLAKRDKEVKK